MNYYYVRYNGMVAEWKPISKADFENNINWSLKSGNIVQQRILTDNLCINIFTPKLTEELKQDWKTLRNQLHGFRINK